MQCILFFKKKKFLCSNRMRIKKSHDLCDMVSPQKKKYDMNEVSIIYIVFLVYDSSRVGRWVLPYWCSTQGVNVGGEGVWGGWGGGGGP